MPERSVRIRSAGFPSWMPAWIRSDLAGQAEAGRVALKSGFSAGERRALRYSPPMPVSEWAERYRMVENSSIRGRWQNIFTPYLVGIMDAANMPGVETVILCKSPQTGGSEAGHNLVGYCIDRLPGPVMYVFPDELTARENAADRIIPLIKGSPRLAAYMTGLGDDASSLRIKLLHMTIHLAWSGSVSRLGNKPVRVLILDELDKYANPRNEASSMELAEKRTTTWRSRRKIFKISTPTTENGPIWQCYTTEANARFDYFARCPHCGRFHHMAFEGIAWPGKDTAEEMKSEEVLSKKAAYYVCPECGACWGDADRDKAVRAGEWREKESGLGMAEYITAFRPQKVAFHVPAWLSYFVSLSEIARAWLRYRETGEMAELKNFKNQYAAKPWVETFEERNDDEILQLCDDRPRGVVPGPLPESPDLPRCSCLLAGVDTQKNYFRYTIRAFGFGESEESWLIQAGALQTFADLEEVLLKASYRDGTGREYRVAGVMVDAMGNRTRDVYAWAARHRGVVFPWQGKRSLSTPYNLTALEYFPGVMGQKIKIPGGLTLFQVDTTFFKSGLAGKLQINPADPGAFHLHSNEQGELDQYAREMTAETWDDKTQAWVNPHGRPNHYWDCEVMTAALAYIKNVRSTRPPVPAAEKPAARRPAPMPAAPARKYGRY